MDTDPQGRARQQSSTLRRTASGALGWVRLHPWGALQILLLLILVVVIAQNLEPTSIDLLFWTVARLPKLLVILISMVIGALIWEAIRRRWPRPRRARGATVTNRTRP